MKILAIIGSPRGMQGNTGRLLEEVLAGVEAFGAESEILSLKTQSLRWSLLQRGITHCLQMRIYSQTIQAHKARRSCRPLQKTYCLMTQVRKYQRSQST